MSDIVVIFDGGRTFEKSFGTIDETAAYLVDNGYTRVSGLPYYEPSVATRVYHEDQSGRLARINTTSTPNTWPVVMDQVVAKVEVLRRADAAEKQQQPAEQAMWRDLYETEGSR